jgi:hypothetical protein
MPYVDSRTEVSSPGLKRDAESDLEFYNRMAQPQHSGSNNDNFARLSAQNFLNPHNQNVPNNQPNQ